MEPSAATTLILDCGRLTGYRQDELELPKEVAPFFGLSASVSEEAEVLCELSNGSVVGFRAIYRSNGMWRIDLTDQVPEVAAGLFPIVDGQRSQRSDRAAIFTRCDIDGRPGYRLRFCVVGSAEYEAEIRRAAASGKHGRTRVGSDGRNFGWR